MEEFEQQIEKEDKEFALKAIKEMKETEAEVNDVISKQKDGSHTPSRLRPNGSKQHDSFSTPEQTNNNQHRLQIIVILSFALPPACAFMITPNAGNPPTFGEIWLVLQTFYLYDLFVRKVEFFEKLCKLEMKKNSSGDMKSENNMSSTQTDNIQRRSLFSEKIIWFAIATVLLFVVVTANEDIVPFWVFIVSYFVMCCFGFSLMGDNEQGKTESRHEQTYRLKLKNQLSDQIMGFAITAVSMFIVASYVNEGVIFWEVTACSALMFSLAMTKTDYFMGVFRKIENLCLMKRLREKNKTRIVVDKVIDSNGGDLEIAESGIKFSVPPGAISDGEQINITVTLYLDSCEAVPNSNIIAPVVGLGPPGTVFNKPCSLQFPHYTVDEKDWDFTCYVRKCDTDKWKKFDDKDITFKVKDENCIIETNHFSDYNPTGEPKDPDTAKTRFKMYIFGKPCKREYHLRVEFWKGYCQKKMDRLKGYLLIDEKEIQLSCVDIIVMLDHISNGWIPEKNKKKFSSSDVSQNICSSCTFFLDSSHENKNLFQPLRLSVVVLQNEDIVETFPQRLTD